MKIEQIPTDSLEIEPGFNVRSDAEVKANAKELAHHLEAFGGYDPSLPITYVQRGKQKLVRSGHTRLAAARLLELPEVAAVKVEDDRIKSLVGLVTSNSGNPLTRRQQGEIFARLRDGEKEDESATIARTKVGEEPVAQYIHEPMDEKAIAEQFHRSAEHVRQCLAIYEAPEGIAELLESDQISANIFITAMQWAGQDAAKAKRILKRAIAVAKDEGSDKATKKHLDAVKSEFVELKAKGAKKKSEAPTGNGAQSEQPGEDRAEAGDQPLVEAGSEAPSLDIGGHNVINPTYKGGTLRLNLSNIIRACSEEYSWAATESDVEGCVEKILEAL